MPGSERAVLACAAAAHSGRRYNSRERLESKMGGPAHHGRPHEEDEREKDKHARLASLAQLGPEPRAVEGPEQRRHEDGDEARTDEWEEGIARSHEAAAEAEPVRPLMEAVVPDRLLLTGFKCIVRLARCPRMLRLIEGFLLVQRSGDSSLRRRHCARRRVRLL